MGEFAISLPAGTYRACFEKLEFGDDVGRRCWADGYDVFGGTDIVVTEGGTTTITPQLPHDAQVKGRIVGAEGVGISAYVVAVPPGTGRDLDLGLRRAEHRRRLVRGASPRSGHLPVLPPRRAS